jgi:hypothetical protein
MRSHRSASSRYGVACAGFTCSVWATELAFSETPVLRDDIIVQEMLYGKETMPLSRDRLLDSLISLVIAQLIIGAKP